MYLQGMKQNLASQASTPTRALQGTLRTTPSRDLSDILPNENTGRRLMKIHLHLTIELTHWQPVLC